MKRRSLSSLRPLRTGFLLLAVLTVVGWACREVTIAPVPVGSVAIDPAGAELAVGERMEFRAVPADSDGNALEGRSVKWVVQDGSVAVVEPSSGEVRAVAEGETKLQARSEGVIGEAHLWVVSGSVRDAESDERPGDSSGDGEAQDEKDDEDDEDDEDEEHDEDDDAEEDDDKKRGKDGNKGEKKGHG